MMMKTYHPFHLVSPSPWPLIGGLSAFYMTFSFTHYIYNKSIWFLITAIMLTMMTMYQWWRDICIEATYSGFHTLKVKLNMKWGMVLFIISEVMLFFSFFWAFFYSSMVPTIQIGLKWPPTPIIPFNPFEVPLLNTMILLSSGVTATWCHHLIKMKLKLPAMISLSLTIFLGLYFTMLQLWEYSQASFSIYDSIYGSLFFMATGFHGFHVIVGSTFLLVNLVRLSLNHYSNTHHFGLEASLWYWHFVDVVWLFLYTFVYFYSI
uniref:Cytochrome c oxidase subunit 3 n=1 Tax=Paratemnoides elongatus TaxID=51805 RepID=H9MFH4_9ARAC|nr:cytochrome c oxidase subunit III [Paratemnoides elongatus]AEX37719.1 cytochrome c oxidase subunit 3 [Paratemnoides elongatus]